MVMGSTAGGFYPRINHIIGAGPIQIEKADFNRDGFLDLAILSVGVTGTNGNTLYVLKGDGEGGFDFPIVEILFTADVGARFTVADLDGDGWSDLALMEPGLTQVRLATNQQETESISLVEFPMQYTADMSSVDIVSGDFSGDGQADLVMSCADGETGYLKMLVSNVDGDYSEGATVPLGFVPTCLVAEDMDGDDQLDLAIGGEQAVLLRGSGGGFDDPIASGQLPGMPNDLAVGDLNNDGYGDFVFAFKEASQLVTLLLEPDSSEVMFIRGDGNNDTVLDLSDAVVILGYLYLQEETDCLESLDVNDDAKVDLSDAISLLTFLYAQGNQPSAPYPLSGTDPDPGQSLGCVR